MTNTRTSCDEKGDVEGKQAQEGVGERCGDWMTKWRYCEWQKSGGT